MRKINLPIQSETEKILSIEGNLERSDLLCLVYSALFNSIIEKKYYTLTELSNLLNKL